MPPPRAWLPADIFRDVADLDFKDDLDNGLASLQFQSALAPALEGLQRTYEAFKPLPIVVSERPSVQPLGSPVPMPQGQPQRDPLATPETPKTPEVPTFRAEDFGSFEPSAIPGPDVSPDSGTPIRSAGEMSADVPPTAGASGYAPSTGRGAEGVERWSPIISEAARQYNVPEAVVKGIMEIESGGNPEAVSEAGALGLMQTMPFHYQPGENGMDPRTNILRGVKILADNYRRWGTWDQAAAAYFGAIDDQGRITDATDATGTAGSKYVQLFRGAASKYGPIEGGQTPAAPNAGASPSPAPAPSSSPPAAAQAPTQSAPAAGVPGQIRIRRIAAGPGGGSIGYETTVSQPDLDRMAPEERARWEVVDGPVAMKTSDVGQADTSAPTLGKLGPEPMPEDASQSERYADSLNTTLPPLGPPMRNEVPYDPETGRAGWPGMQRAPLTTAQNFLPGDGGTPPQPTEQPYDPDQGPRESGYTLPPAPLAGDDPGTQTVKPANPVYGPIDPWMQPNPAIPGSVRASDLPERTYDGDDRSWRQPAPVPQGGIQIPDATLDQLVPRYTQQPAPTPQEAPVAPLPPGGLRVPGYYRNEPAEDAAAEIERNQQYQPGPPSNPLEQAVAATARAPFFRETAGEQAVDIYNTISSLPFDAYAAARRQLISDLEAKRVTGIDPIAPLRAAFPDTPWPSVEFLNPDKRPAGDVLMGMLIAGALPDPTDPIVATALQGVGRAASLGARGVRATGEAVQGAARRGSELLEQGRSTARELNAQPQGAGTFGTLGISPDEQAMRGLTRPRVVPPEVADTLDFPVRIPDDPATIRAIESIGGTVDPERGVTLNVTRAQGPSAAGGVATRGGVFYEAVPEGGRSSFVRGADDPNAVGGTQVIPPTPTRFRSPLILSDAPGGDVGFNDGMRQLGVGVDEAAVLKAQVEVERIQGILQRLSPGDAAHDMATDALADAQRILDVVRSRAVTDAQINTRIRMARAAGPEGSPARAQALKDVVSRYGGDPNLIDDLLKIRGADASESAWAIKENILAANARKQGYDGVVTVAEVPPIKFELDNHPSVAPLKAAHQKSVETLGAFHPETEKLLADLNAMRNQVRPEMSSRRITELMDPREARNPTPASPTAEMKAAYKRAKDAEARYQATWNDPLPSGVAEREAFENAREAAYRELQESEAALDTLMNEAESLPSGYTLREDIPRRAEPQRSISLNAGFGALPEEGATIRRGGAPMDIKPGKRLDSEWVYHNTSQDTLAAIERDGFDAGSFSERPIDFGGDVWVAARKSDLPDPQVHDYGGVRAWEPAFEFHPGGDSTQFPERLAISPDKLVLVDKRGRVIRPLGTTAIEPPGAAASAGALPSTPGSGILPTVNRAASEAIVGGTGGAVIEQARNPDEDPRTAAARGFAMGAVGFPVATRAARGLARRAGAAADEGGGALATLGFSGRPANEAASAAPNPIMQNMARQMAGQHTPTGIVNKRGLAERWAQAMTDDRAGIRTFQEAVSAAIGRPLTAGESVAELTRVNPASIASQRLDDSVKPLLQAVGDDEDYLAQYLVHSHNVDVAREMGQRAYEAAIQAGASPQMASRRAMAATSARQFSGDLKLAETVQQLQEIEQRVLSLPDGAARWQSIKDAAQGVWDFNRETLERKKDAGIISDALFTDLTSKYPKYARTDIADYFDKGTGGPGGGGKRIGLSDIGVQKISAAGTTKERVNPLLSTIDQTYSAETAIARNKAGQAFEELLRLDPAWQSTFKEVVPAQGVNRGNPATTVPSSYTLKNGEQYLRVWDGGAERTYVIPPEYAALVSPKVPSILNSENLGAKLLVGAMNTYKSLITSKNPAFSLVVSPIRDAGDYAIREGALSATKGGPLGFAQGAASAVGAMSDYVKAVPDAFAGILEGTYKGDLARMMREGAGQGGRPRHDQRELRNALRDLQRTNGLEVKNVGDVARLVGNVLTLGAGPVGNRIEQVPRLAAARRAAKRGASDLGQAMTFRDATVDFQRAGEWSRAINTVVPFFNVAMQSGAQTVRAAKANPAAFLGAVAASVGTMSMAAEAWNHADDQRAQDYDDVPEYLKKTGVVFMLPGVGGTSQRGDRLPNYVWLPVGQYGALVQTAKEKAKDWIDGKSGADLSTPRGWAELGSEVAGIFSPIRGESAGSVATSIIPPGLSTAADLAADRDLYRGSKISTDRRDEQASALSQGSASAFNTLTGQETRPSQWEHAYRDLGGYAATLATEGSNLVTERLGLRRPKDEDRPLQNAPIVGGLTNRIVRDSGGRRLEEATEDDARVPESVRVTLQEAGMRREELTPVGSKYKGAELTRAEQERWQQVTNAMVSRELSQVRRSAEWRERGADKKRLIQDAITKAKQAAAERALRRLDDSEIERRTRRQESRKAG